LRLIGVNIEYPIAIDINMKNTIMNSMVCIISILLNIIKYIVL